MRRITLEALALSPKERTILTILRQQSSADKISMIAIKAKLPHTTTGFILKKLEKRKLAKRVKHDNHFRWVYRNIIEVVEESSQDSSSGVFLNIVSGMENITKEFIKILELSPTERFYSIQGAGTSKAILKKNDTQFLEHFHHEIKRRKIIIEGVVAESVFRLFEKMHRDQLSSHLDRMTVAYILPDELINFPFDIVMFRDCILLVDYEKERLVRIQDNGLSQVFKSLFRITEEYGRKIDLNQHIRKLIAKNS
jgi:DNA-binding Lrp family transcriptional regulator